MELSKIVADAVVAKASDVHFKTGIRPAVRDRNGSLRFVSDQACTKDEMRAVLYFLLKDRADKFLADHTGEIDGGAVAFGARIRYNAFFDQSGPAIAVRILREDILGSLGLPDALRNLMKKKEGLILFCGATGSGKTTAMYGLLDETNRTQHRHIITLDQPTEIILPSDHCIVSQREIGTDSASFADALRAAVREDPDILLVGEMRDYETVSTALAAAETGHLVLSTIHSDGVEGIVDRILPFFPASAYAQVRSQLADSFIGMVGCRILPRRGGGRIGAYELLLRTIATAAAIREGKTMHLKDLMLPSHNMQTMEAAIESLRFQGLINEDAEDEH